MTLVITPEQCAGYAYDAGARGDALVMAVAIAGAESTYDVDNIGDVNLEDAKWGKSYGLWQIRSLKSERGTGKARDEFALYPTSSDHADPAFNARSMWSISSGGTNWKPWSTFKNGAYKKFLPQARAAAAHPSHSPGSPTAAGTPGAPSPTPSLPSTPIKYLAGTGSVEGLQLTLGGRGLAPGSLGGIVLAAGNSIQLSAQQVSQLTLVVSDPDQDLTSKRVIDINTPIDYLGVRWLPIGRKQGASTAGQPQLTLRCQPAVVVALRKGNPLPMTNVSPTEYIAEMASFAGAKFRGQVSAKRPSIGPVAVQTQDPHTPQRLETGWEVAARLANELGYLFFESLAQFLFGTLTPLVNASVPVYVSYRGWRFPNDQALGQPLEAMSVPEVDESVAAAGAVLEKATRTVTVQVPRPAGEKAYPGLGLTIAGGVYLSALPADPTAITAVSWSLDDLTSPVTIVAGQLDPPTPSAADKLGQDQPITSTGVPTAGSKSALDFVSFCLSQVGDKYVYGAEVPLDDPDPKAHGLAFDCSELTQWAAARTGVTLPDGSSNQLAFCQSHHTMISLDVAAKTRGALLFHPGHVAVSLGDGLRTVEAMGAQYGVLEGDFNQVSNGRAVSRFSSAAKVPGLVY